VISIDLIMLDSSIGYNLNAINRKQLMGKEVFISIGMQYTLRTQQHRMIRAITTGM